MSAKKAETINCNGVELALDENVMSEKMIDVIRNGKYEEAESRQIPAIVQPGDRIVELGAGVGYIASLAAKLQRAESIAVYEANPKLIPLIETNRANNEVEFDIYNMVVMPDDKPDKMPFYVRKDFWASSLSPTPWGYKEEIQVDVRPFRDLLRIHRPTMLIVDIEGGELQLFRNIPLTGITKVYIELHQQVVGRIGMKEVFDFFSSRDFHYDQWHSRGGVVLFSHVLR